MEDHTHNRSGKRVRQIVNGRVEQEIRYDTANRAELETNARGFTTQTTRNEFEQIVRIDYPDGSSVQRRYSALNLQRLEETDEAGSQTRYDYDAQGNLIRKTEAAGLAEQRITEFRVDSRGRTTELIRKGRTEADGSVTTDAVWKIDYDAQGRIAKTTDPEGGIRLYVYDRAGHLVQSTDPNGHATRYQVDAAGHLLKITDALDRVRSFEYDKAGNLTSLTDARAKSTVFAYDAMNRRIRTTHPVGGVATVEYDGQGLPISQTDEDGRTEYREFDTFQRLIKQVDGLGNETRFGYQIADGSASGQLGSLDGPSETSYPTFTQQTKYDPRERPTVHTLLYNNRAGAQSVVNGVEYDARGRVVRQTDAEGKSRTTRYGALGQPIEAVDALGGKTGYGYDARGNLIRLTDANGHTHRFEYDRNDRLIRESLPMGQTTRYRYDAAGNLIERTDPNGIRTDYAYDGANRLREIRQYQADGTLVRTTGYTRDAADNLTAWTDTDAPRPPGQQTASGTASYDDANRKTGETVSYPNPQGTAYSLSYGYQYSPAGKKTRITWPDGTAIDYGYSAHGQLETITLPGEGSISVNQYRWTEPAQIALPGGQVQEKTYDGLLNLEGLKLKTADQRTPLNLTHSYGKRQELTARSRTDTLDGDITTVTGSFRYDDELRLIESITDDGGLFGSDTETFTLDPVGNRTAHSEVLGEWSYNANNQLTDKGILLDAMSYEYDPAGNLIRKTEVGRTTHYRYDPRNRLIEVKDGDGNPIARYGYDPFDRRIWKEQYRDKDGNSLSPAKRSYYLYADEGLIAEAEQAISLPPLPQGEGWGEGITATTPPALLAQYGPKPDSPFTTGTLFVKTRNSNGQDNVGYYQHDHLQTPIQATDKTGRVIWSAQYNVFGRATLSTPTTADKPAIRSDLRLPGQVEDEETGLHYNWHRYYDPEVGRYVTADPIGLEEGINYYAYVRSNPVTRIDPTGLFEEGGDDGDSGGVTCVLVFKFNMMTSIDFFGDPIETWYCVYNCNNRVPEQWIT